MKRPAHPVLGTPLFVLALLLTAACEAPETGIDEGAFVVRLGTDTTAVERYSLTDRGMEALAVSRSPRTLLREATLEFDDEGGIVRYESRVVDPLAEEGNEVVQRTVIRYGEEGAESETTQDDEVRTTQVEAAPDMVPFSFNHFSLMELALRRGLTADRSEIHLLSGGPMPVQLRRLAPDSVVIETGALGAWRARVDGDGRILEMAAGALGRDVERTPDLDVEALAGHWADEDARGAGMGPLSPRDTIRATVHGVELEVDYSRPAKRGRPVFGGLVPYGEVWRTGANQATHLTVSRSLSIAGERIPAGTYTIFTLPEPDGWTLIVNRETGQAGTEYDPDQDLLRASMEVEPLDPPFERFTIAVDEEGDGGVLAFRWGGTEARIPFRIEGGG